MLFKYICLYIKLKYVCLKYKLSIRRGEFQNGKNKEKDNN